MQKLSNKASLSIKKFVTNNIKMIISIFISVITFRISQYYYFGGNPFLNFTYLGESLLGAVSFIVIYLLSSTFIQMLYGQFKIRFRNIMSDFLYDFWNTNFSRISQSMTRKTESTKPAIRDSEYLEGNLLDTSALIDGRIIGVIKTGFISSKFIVLQGVVDELQNMADKSDVMKRTKGRLGLDNLKKIKNYVGVKNFYLVSSKGLSQEVDKSLVQFGKANKCNLITVDFNLNKAAQVSGVKVLNINRLANEVKSTILPGEKLSLKLIQKGKEKDQAVGYLADGTMIVVHKAADEIGHEKEVTVEKVLQTDAGKMIFASIS